MLGKHVGSMKGQTAVKALPSEYGMPKLETTGAGEGTLSRTTGPVYGHLSRRNAG